VSIDPFRLAHWMNTRKYTAAQVAQLAGLPGETLDQLLADKAPSLTAAEVASLAAALQVDASQLSPHTERDLTVISQSAEALAETRRPIQRDGIHFYNYYSMAGPAGRVAPVILDILCPAGRLPALNNGHLEPAITVNLGPGDIYGRWGEELTPLTWRVLEANTGEDNWITGSSYVEPSHCPHTYSLVTDKPARIVSYTGQSNIAGLVDDFNTWPESAFQTYLEWLSQGPDTARVLDLLLARRGFTRETVCVVAGVSEPDLAAAITDPIAGLHTLRTVARAVGIDYRVLLPAERRHDEVGKSCMDLDETRESKRRFGPYEVASMASAPHLPDLTAFFIKVDSDGTDGDGYLVEPAECHYLVGSGEVSLEWIDARGQVAVTKLTADGSAWVGPFVRHRWYGNGSVLKFGSGAHVGYLDLMETTNTFDPASTARRSRRDVAGWGYDR